MGNGIARRRPGAARGIEGAIGVPRNGTPGYARNSGSRSNVSPSVGFAGSPSHSSRTVA